MVQRNCLCISARHLTSGGPDDLAGGDRHSVELTEARNQSLKPQDPVGLLRVHWVSCGRDPCKQ
ncbi:hypothetical protein GmHk_17G049541 [Glycine max]|nr:hypothetical protein GmHk_17G049541 [Glycine max]